MLLADETLARYRQHISDGWSFSAHEVGRLIAALDAERARREQAEANTHAAIVDLLMQGQHDPTGDVHLPWHIVEPYLSPIHGPDMPAAPTPAGGDD